MAKNCYMLTQLSIYWGSREAESGKVRDWAHMVLTIRQYCAMGDRKIPLPGSAIHWSQWLHGQDAKDFIEFAKCGEQMEGIENAAKFEVFSASRDKDAQMKAEAARKLVEDWHPEILCLYSCFGMKLKTDTVRFDIPHVRVSSEGNVIKNAKPVQQANFCYFVGGDASNKGSEYGKEAALARIAEEYKPAELAGAEDDQDDAEMHQDDGE